MDPSGDEDAQTEWEDCLPLTTGITLTNFSQVAADPICFYLLQRLEVHLKCIYCISILAFFATSSTWNFIGKNYMGC